MSAGELMVSKYHYPLSKMIWELKHMVEKNIYVCHL